MTLSIVLTRKNNIIIKVNLKMTLSIVLMRKTTGTRWKIQPTKDSVSQWIPMHQVERNTNYEYKYLY